jgi:hypothetical protein
LKGCIQGGLAENHIAWIDGKSSQKNGGGTTSAMLAMGIFYRGLIFHNKGKTATTCRRNGNDTDILSKKR